MQRKMSREKLEGLLVQNICPEINSPYNTYENRGLPPGPICNPGLNAIKAAIYPEFTDYNYFLNRQDTGETIFSKTYEEHLRNKAKYLK